GHNSSQLRLTIEEHIAAGGYLTEGNVNFAPATSGGLSTLRHTPLLTLEPVYRRVGRLGKPSLLIWGTADHVVPFAHQERVRAAIPNIEFHAIEGADHTAQQDNPEAVHAMLTAFFSRADAAE
ncbi:MAG TPA: alpha/beta hydrolase, partial [Candidatus Hydrogenedentes bacterium]|nr:alpha/beta hydrolase [Candidatus Hydrogenedentota bacterium]